MAEVPVPPPTGPEGPSPSQQGAQPDNPIGGWGVNSVRDVQAVMQPQPGPDNWDQQAFADRAREAEATRAIQGQDYKNEPYPREDLFEKPTNDSEQKAFAAAVETYMETLTGGRKTSPEDIQRVIEAMKKREGEEKAREEGEKRGIAEGAAAATMEILTRPEFQGLFRKEMTKIKQEDALELIRTTLQEVLDKEKSKLGDQTPQPDVNPQNPPTPLSSGIPGK